MIVFNCSQAFAEFIEPRKAGPAPLVCEAPSPHRNLEVHRISVYRQIF